MINKEIKKIKAQKTAAIFLIIVPMIMLISYIGMDDFEKHSQNNYIACGSLIILIFCGSIGLKNSLRKKKELGN